MKATFSNTAGFTLAELMIAIGIMAILSAFAMPAYNNYIQTSEQGVLVTNMSTIEVFQEDFRMRNGNYANDLADTAAITAAIDWDPQDTTVAYSIAASGGTTYEVTATSANGISVCLEFPAKDPC